MEATIHIILIVVILTTFIGVYAYEEFATVTTKSGPIKGIVSVQDNEVIYKFLKIPYAQPPIGNLRFKKPVPVKTWQDTLDASVHPPACMQSSSKFASYAPSPEMSEDCLYLSIYVPRKLSPDSKMSVMVYIHGGAYNYGQASLYDGSHLALIGDVIVVIVNYRLNIFGFLTTFDSVARGNYGILDNILALKWVKKNVEAFGGNPSSITIFGQSAGGFIVGYLSLIPSNKGLFHRVIAQSGTPNSPLASNDEHTNFMSYLSEAANCNEPSASGIVDCLRKVKEETLINLAELAFWDSLNTAFLVPFSPRVDGLLIVDKARNLLKDSTSESTRFFRSLDILIGFTTAEGSSLLTSSISQSKEPINIAEGISTTHVCNSVLPNIINTHYDEMFELKEVICRQYSANIGIPDSKMQQAKKLVDLHADWIFHAPAIQMLNAHVKGNEVGKSYHYVFNRSFESFSGSPLPRWFEGAPHSSDLPYLLLIQHFNKLTNRTLTGKDRLLSDSMLRYWTNFAKNGNPNEESLPVWPHYTAEKREFLELGLDIKAGQISPEDRLKFWLEDVPNLVQRLQHPIHQEL